MLARTYINAVHGVTPGETGPQLPDCVGAHANAPAAEIAMTGYSEGTTSILLCRDCAIQLSRKLLEDLCEVVTGDRHG